ncbi:hypothetical protein [Nocardioides sp. cx-173]|uniref:hypothetical protein n=1 Tax=Nocardioides sp. cx-173 TaxID=2898796 RepID=UPI001E5279C8|nr:hypothetical protein [Nocardioides sp. cx-173]MCD4524436.1 hypothetical protein [Nocardioides sp. cx-173]UGB43078.1 hypothetical protein LQ940_06015 [Nocardioides sp. cx-173]
MTSAARLLTAAALVVAAVGGASAPTQAAAAMAAPCSGGGVTVVVDFHELGGGVDADCDQDGAGKRAADLFASVGHPLTYAARQAGFVCRVSGLPQDDPCVTTAPADAYWGLWWSDGESGTWTYSGLGAGALTIPDGGYVALSWDQRGGDARPRLEPGAASSGATPGAPADRAPADTAPATAPAGDGLPAFVAPVLIGTLFGAAGVAFLLRRRSGRT